MKTSSRKGRIVEVVPFVFILIVGSTFTVSAFSITEAYGNQIEETYNGLNRLVQTRSSSELYFYNYLPMGATYSIHQTSYELASSGGGDDVEWRYDNLGTSTTPGVASEIYLKMSPGAETSFNEDYLVAAGGSGCNIELTEYRILPEARFRKDVEATLYNENPLEAVCSFEEGETKYSGGEESFHATVEASDNRFYVLVDETASFFKDLRDEWKKVSDSYSGSGSSCGSPSSAESQAESSARSSVSSAIDSGFSSITGSYSAPEGMEATVELRSKSIDVSDADANPSGDCNCVDIDDDGEEECSTLYSATTTASPQEAEVFFSLKDTEYRIPVEEGWKHLDFTVDTYLHNFQRD